MLIAIIILVVSLFLGICSTAKIKAINSLTLLIAAGSAFGMASFSFIIFAVYALVGSINPTTTLVSILISLGIGILLCGKSSIKRLKSLIKKDRMGMPKALFLATFTIFIIMDLVIITTLFTKNGAIYCANINTCSDLSYHIGIGNSIIYTHFPPKYLFTIQTKNIFPFITDLYASLLIYYGMPLVSAIYVQDILLFFSLTFLVAFTAFELTKKQAVAIITELIFWFENNYAVALPLYAVWKYLPNVIKAIQGPNSLLAIYGIYKLHGLAELIETTHFMIDAWTNIFYVMLLPQRDFLLGLSFGMLISYLAYKVWFLNKEENKSDLIMLGLLTGMLPLIHPPTLIVIIIVQAFLLAYDVIGILRKKSKFGRIAKKWIFIIAPAIAFAVPQIIYMFSQKLATGWYHFIYLDLIYYGNNLLSTIGLSIIHFVASWVEFLGIPAILALIGIKYAKQDLKLFSMPFLILFILINVYTFQPNAADENKMGVYILFILAIFSAYALEALWRKGIFSKTLVVFLILITIGGFISPYYYWITRPFVLFSKPQLETAQFILNNTSPNSIFATSDYENLFQLVSSIAARETLISIYYYVSLDVHTLPLEALVNINNEIIENASCTAAEEYNISYIYFRTSNLNDTKAFNNNSNFSVVYFKIDNQTDNPNGRYLIIYKSLCRKAG